MPAKDYELDRLRSEIDAAQRKIDNAKSRLDLISSRRDSYNSEIQSCKYRIADLRNSIDREYEAVRICRQNKDRYYADDHKYKAQSFQNALSREREILNSYYEKKNGFKAEFDSALGALRDAKARKKRASDAFHARLNQVRAEREKEKAQRDQARAQRDREKAKWHETRCKKCGAPIRYHEDWAHIPNYCKSCKESFGKKSR